MNPLTRSRDPLWEQPSTWLLLALTVAGGVLLRRRAAKKGVTSTGSGGATAEQVARIRETADAARELPLP